MNTESGLPDQCTDQPSPTSSYIGRFAPSPSGPLHFGSLVSALASYLDAKANSGQWLVRIDDIDPPREIPGAADTILHQLQQHGLQWDGQVLYQSQRSNVYLSVLEQLQQAGLIYPCQCSRQQLKENGGIHNDRCEIQDPSAPSALRLSVVDPYQITFNDIFQGSQQQDIKYQVGDMVLYRKDNLFAYQLAVVIDDAHQGITHVIRGSDLLDSTPRQIYLQQQLKLPTPAYGHIPVAINCEGQKLSKQNLAAAADNKAAQNNLATAIRWLGLPLPNSLISTNNSTLAHCDELLVWAIEHWQRELIPPILERLASN
jgi:glutamyl-Q tRNA(Asp) synthetase